MCRDQVAVDLPGLCFQYPIAAQRARAGDIGRSRHVCLRKPGDVVQQCLSRRAGSDIATVDQEVAIGAQCIADVLQRFRPRFNGPVVQRQRTGLHRAAGTMRNQMNRIHILAALQITFHLQQTIGMRVQHHNLGILAQRRDHRSLILDPRVNKHNLAFDQLPALDRHDIGARRQRRRIFLVIGIE